MGVVVPEEPIVMVNEERGWVPEASLWGCGKEAKDPVPRLELRKGCCTLRWTQRGWLME